MRALVLLLVFVAGCRSDEVAKVESQGEARSLLGPTLERPALDDERAARLEADLDAARAAWQKDPTSEDAAIWVGRRLAYLGRYQDAIAWYSDRLREHPDSFRLLRHRGHRYVSVRELDAAIADLERAAALARDVPDEWEPDGAPNRYGIPRSTNHSNIDYHLGLALYLSGDYERALPVYRRCMAYASVSDDMLVATAHWLYMTLRRLGREREAQESLAAVGEAPGVIENFGYLHLIRMYRRELMPGAALAMAEGGIQEATVGYGVASWSLSNGHYSHARRLMKRIISNTPWAAFGHIAAEADLARAR